MEGALITFDSSAYRRAISSHADVGQTSQSHMLLVLLKRDVGSVMEGQPFTWENKRFDWTSPSIQRLTRGNFWLLLH